MITLDKFMRGVDEIVNSKPVYKSGGDGRAGECDCIGLIIGAIRRAGGEWRGTHGSNYAARNEMQTLESPPRLEVGAAVYKYHEPGQAGWNLPAAYPADNPHSVNLIQFAKDVEAATSGKLSITVHAGATAPEAAGEIHSDFQKGFIRAETIAYDDYVTLGGEAKAREAGKLRAEGKAYVVHDGDVMHFLHS